MQDELLLELWNIRFKKILALEKEAVDLYSSLLEENKEFLEGNEVDIPLKEILEDEKRHVRIASKLCQLIKELKKNDSKCF